MRDLFINQLIEEIKIDPSIILITADLGFGSFDEISREYPNNFLNVGVAEQNMIGVAAGMALVGRKPFCYSIGNFSTLRCLEQIRNDSSYHSLNISIVSNGGGFSYGGLGVTHHATEDVSVMLSIPEVQVLVPSTDIEVKKITNFAANQNNTKYIRLDKSFVVDGQDNFDLAPLRVIQEGNDLNILCYGSILEEALKISENFTNKSIGIISTPIVSEINFNGLKSVIQETKNLITLEENSIMGGLGSLVATILLTNNADLDLFRSYGIKRDFSEVVGDQGFMRKHFNINSEYISKDLVKMGFSY